LGNRIIGSRNGSSNSTEYVVRVTVSSKRMGPLSQLLNYAMPVSERVRGEHTRDAQLELAEVVRNRVVIADDERGEPGRIEMLR
jgi:hypothetical protein